MTGNFKDIVSRLEAQKAAIDKAISVLREFDEGVPSESPAPAKRGPKKGVKRVMSEAGRKAIGDAARRRWAAVKRAAKRA